MPIRSLVAVLALAAAPLLANAQAHQHEDNSHAKMEHPVTIVVIVRHAEKAAAPANDPPLTAVGVERAQALAAALKDSKVGAVLHTPTTRTRETARPVAELFGLTPQVLPLGPAAAHADAVAEAVKAHAGKTVVVVGHSNTIMNYIAALGGPKRGELCDHQYDGLYTVVIAHGEATLVEGRYGPPNPADTKGCAAMMTPAIRP